MKINNRIVIFFFLISVIAVGFASYRIYLSQLPNSLENMDYIKMDGTDSIIRLKSVKEIEPTIWKGSNDGTLFYKSGASVKIKISYYGEFFGIKGESNGLVSDKVLYEYISE